MNNRIPCNAEGQTSGQVPRGDCGNGHLEEHQVSLWGGVGMFRGGHPGLGAKLLIWTGEVGRCKACGPSKGLLWLPGLGG